MMLTISALSSNFPLIPPTKLLKGGLVDNTTNFGAILPSQVCKLQVKVDNYQDPLKLNNFDKAVKDERKRRMYTQDEYVVGQNFLVRLYELDIHEKASLEALLNYTQETGLNLFQSSGLVVEGFGVSKEMTSRNLIWVIGRMQVEVYTYPSWGDIVQVETWCSALSKHSLTCSSSLTDANTGHKIMRVDSEFVMINEKTRRLSKIPEEIKARGDPYVRDYLDPLLPPLWFDLDPNQHVNNVKYISWILEGTPESVRENYELAGITLEYRRECGRESVLQSLSSASNEAPHEFHHLLRLENGNEVARARTSWRRFNKPISTQ
ncbi:Palmitoyl-acyl carrier protein thioesterase chloroplastic [Bienertia sinuspersici]